MTDKESKETKGLLIPFNSDDMHKISEYFIKDNLKFVRQNKKKSDLNASMHSILKENMSM